MSLLSLADDLSVLSLSKQCPASVDFSCDFWLTEFLNQEAKMAKFSIGDVVELNSDGPKMTVKKVGPVAPPSGMTGAVFKLAENEVQTSWFEMSKEIGYGKVCDAIFDERCLKPVRAASAK